jgi:hypothetical protein
MSQHYDPNKSHLQQISRQQQQQYYRNQQHHKHTKRSLTNLTENLPSTFDQIAGSCQRRIHCCVIEQQRIARQQSAKQQRSRDGGGKILQQQQQQTRTKSKGVYTYQCNGGLILFSIFADFSLLFRFAPLVVLLLVLLLMLLLAACSMLPALLQDTS